MAAEKNDLDDLAREVQQVIMDNKKFLARIMDDDFEPDPSSDDDQNDIVES